VHVSSPRHRRASGCASTDVAGIAIYTTAIRPEWIDYNGHLRDAYYSLIASEATDALMERVGLDAAYRARTGCTLYTVEMHVHFLQEVKQSDTAAVSVRLLGFDHKRIHALFEIARAGAVQPAANVEMMLLHVRQERERAVSAPFPPEVTASLAQLAAASATLPPANPGSRRMELPARRTPHE
jgi:acyl-CoA thioester hydrolase